MDLADFELAPDDFTLDKSVKGASVFIGQRLWAKFSGPTTFMFPPQSVVLGLRGTVDGAPLGNNQENVTPATGSFDPSSRTFAMDVAAQDVDQGVQRTMVAHLVGVIDNLPPTAVITGSRTLECGHGETLSGGSSHDPDTGDAISRFQWLVDGAPGGSQDHVAVLSAKLGPTDYDLRVYDKSMAAGHATARVNVVDTTPPLLPPPARTTIFVSDLAADGARGRHEIPVGLKIDLAECIGAATVQDTCVGPLDVSKTGKIEHVELLAFDEDNDHDTAVKSRGDLQRFERQPFFRDGCERFSIDSPVSVELPLHPRPLLPEAGFRVTYSVSDPSGNRAIGQCTVDLMGSHTRDAALNGHHRPPTVVGCALCIGQGCPSSCPRFSSVCSEDRDRGGRH